MGLTIPKAGHRFNPYKLLLDPYARRYAGQIIWDDALFGYQIGSKRADLAMSKSDSAPFLPKCMVVGESDPPRGARPNRPWHETVIYEAHVKGMTARHPDVPEPMRGTFAGLANPAVIDHLVKLGVTAIELLPVHAFVNDRHLVEEGLSNYWGYNSIGFFAPAERYISPGAGLEEFRTMVDRLHDAGIEVILDVVYNHTAEGNALGPTLSFRGIDNASYYKLAEDKRHYFDTTGCGNTLNIGQPRVLQLVMDSLRYWVEQCGVDGFRFDLASAHGPRRQRLRSERLVPRCRRPRSRAEPGKADRRAMGSRRERLPGRRLSAGLGGMERPLARRLTLLLEGRHGHAAGARDAEFPARPRSSTTAAANHGQASISSPPMTASPCATSSPTTASTIRRTRKTTRTATTTTGATTGASRGRPTIPPFSISATACAAP